MLNLGKSRKAIFSNSCLVQNYETLKTFCLHIGFYCPSNDTGLEPFAQLQVFPPVEDCSSNEGFPPLENLPPMEALNQALPPVGE